MREAMRTVNWLYLWDTYGDVVVCVAYLFAWAIIGVFWNFCNVCF
jgi:hypothetical protein